MPLARPLPNTYWALPGVLLAGEHPSGLTAESTRQRVGTLLTAGMECFLDLTHPSEIEPYDQELPFHIEYLRKPIRDHSLPERREHMMEILDCLHDALHSARPVYVHCRAGIGRTGMVIGCLLVERGLTGEQALDELAGLWRQSERSRSWPSVPETDAQTDYIRRWARRVRLSPPQEPPYGLQAPLRAPQQSPQAPTPALRASTHARPAPPHALQAPTHAPQARIRPPQPAHAPYAPPQVWQAPAHVLQDPETSDSHGALDAPMADASFAAAADSDATADPLLDPATLAAARSLRERFLGALLGLATGDALAAATQFRRPGSFTPVGDLLGGGPFSLPRGGWSDDTAMSLCLADSLLATDGFDARDQVERYQRWRREGYLSATGECLGITASTARALSLAEWRRQLFSGSHAPDHLDPEPLGRVAPVVLFYFGAEEEAIQLASEAARTTCQAPAVLGACRELARALHRALSGQPKARILAEHSSARAGRRPAGRRSGSVSEALAIALEAFAATDNFRDAVLHAANRGGNSDVAAAACGQLAGAHYGASAIPASWRQSLLKRDLIESYADRLLQHFLLKIG